MPLISVKSAEEKKREKILRLVERAEKVEFGSMLIAHPWYRPMWDSILARSKILSAEQNSVVTQIKNDELKRLDYQLIRYVVDRLKQAPDAEVKLENFATTYGLGPLFINDLRRFYGLSDVGKFFIEKLSAIHQKWTDIPFTEELAVDSITHKKIELNAYWC